MVDDNNFLRSIYTTISMLCVRPKIARFLYPLARFIQCGKLLRNPSSFSFISYNGFLRDVSFFLLYLLLVYVNVVCRYPLSFLHTNKRRILLFFKLLIPLLPETQKCPSIDFQSQRDFLSSSCSF